VAQDLQTLLPWLPVQVIYNATNVGRFCPGPGHGCWLDAQAGLAPIEMPLLRVGLVATYARWKGQDVFLEAAAQAIRRLAPQSVRFYIVGGPIYQTAGSQFSREELQWRASQLGIESHVAFVPFQSDPTDCYRALDVVVHASTRPEPFGLTIVEAMACGRAVIAARAGGAAELFQSGFDALGVTPGDAVALAEAIVQLAQVPDLRRQLGTQARTTAVARFDQRRLGEELRKVYAGLGSARSTPVQVL
jgi:glycosyltransferase involved in cell wall biosynthesis